MKISFQVRLFDFGLFLDQALWKQLDKVWIRLVQKLAKVGYTLQLSRPFSNQISWFINSTVKVLAFSHLMKKQTNNFRMSKEVTNLLSLGERSLYPLLWDWIWRQVNSMMCQSDPVPDMRVLSLSDWVVIWLSVCPFDHLSVHPSVPRSNGLDLSNWQSFYVFVDLSTSVYPFPCLSVHQLAWPVHLSVHLFDSLSIWLMSVHMSLQCMEIQGWNFLQIIGLEPKMLLFWFKTCECDLLASPTLPGHAYHQYVPTKWSSRFMCTWLSHLPWSW